MMTNCVIIHGCPDDAQEEGYNKHRMPWVQSQLVSSGIPTQRPSMPNPWAPNYEAYSEAFQEDINENTILIGHSCGAAFLVHRLGDNHIKINHLVLVAPRKIASENNEIQKHFYEYPIDESIKDRVNHITIFTADNEDDDGKLSAKIFHDTLGGDLIELTGKGHYTLGDMETEEFPELLEVIRSHLAKTPLEH